MELDKRLRKIAHLEKRIDTIMLYGNDPNFFYFTNTKSSETFCYDFSEPLILSSRMNAEQSGKGWIKRIIAADIKTRSEYFKELKEVFGKGKVIGVNKNSLPVSFYNKLKRRFHVVDISKELEEVRMIKTDYEVSCIKKACIISGKAFKEVRESIRPGVTENEVAGLLELAARKNNARLFMDPVVAFGDNTRMPHHETGLKKLRKGEPVLIDFSVSYRGYISDTTRMINSRFEVKLNKVMDELYPNIKPGIKAMKLELFARKALGDYEKYFTHSLGHGVGIAIHERPSISRNSKDILRPGMVFTLEPGVYTRNEGARIEDVFFLTKTGKKKMSVF